MESKTNSIELKKQFKDKAFTNKELYDFYLKKESELKENTFRWRVYKLKKEGLIYSPKRGVYMIKSKTNFNPSIDKDLYSIYNKIISQFPYSDICIWETKWLNKYMVHQVVSNNIMVEIDKKAGPAAFAFSQDFLDNVFLNPGKNEVENYIQPGQRNIIIKNLLVDSPLENLGNIRIPRVEKIIVDLFVDDILYRYYQGGELKNIYEEFFNNYNINQSTLKRYATRRGAGDKLIAFLKEETDINREQIHI